MDYHEGTEIRIWGVENCGVMQLLGITIPDEDGNYEYNYLGKGEYLVVPLNGGATFDPSSRRIGVPRNKAIDFVVVE